MEELRVHLFGGVEIYRGEALLPAFPTQKSLSLFAYLVLSRGRLVHRDTICGQFWGDQSDVEARKLLRTCLWRIRSVIEPREDQRGAFLQVEGSQIRFAPSSGTWVDVWEFEDSLKASQIGEALESGAIEPLERAAALYRGDFLEGLHDDWCFLHRERLRLGYLTALERLVHHHKVRGHWLDVIARGKQILREDALREHIHRAVMESHMEMGDRPSALRQYQLCARMLRDELDITPMEETLRLYGRIREDRPLLVPDLLGANARRELEPAGFIAEVDGALLALHALTERLERTRSALTLESAAAPPSVLTANHKRRRLLGVEAAGA